jgi:AhpD family alkylhydroperoxidase
MAMRINYPVVGGEPLKIMLSMEGYLQRCGIEKPLLELVKMRASQINGCAYCLDMHSKDARAAGETEQRLYLLNAWREAPFYSDRERAALEWTEVLTQISTHHVSDELFARVRAVFSEKEIVDLTYQVMAINAWNRLAISMKSEPGHYKPAAK